MILDFPLLVRRLGKVAKCLQSRVYLRAAVRGVLPVSNLEKALRTVAPDTVIDVGANRGQFALVVRRLFPEARVVAFEPLEEAAKVFEGLFSSEPEYRIHRAAIGPQNEEKDLIVTEDGDSSSFLAATERLTSRFPGARPVARRRVPVRRLSEFLDERFLHGQTLLKLDVQGFELEVLQGSSDLLHAIEWVLVEASYQELYQGQAPASDVDEYLTSFGFRLLGTHSMKKDKEDRDLQADLLYGRDGGT